MINLSSVVNLQNGDLFRHLMASSDPHISIHAKQKGNDKYLVHEDVKKGVCANSHEIDLRTDELSIVKTR